MKSPIMGMFLGEEYIVKYLEKSSLFQFFLLAAHLRLIGTHHRYNITDNYAPDMSSPFLHLITYVI